MLTRNNLKKLANPSIGSEKDWESEDAAKALKKTKLGGKRYEIREIIEIKV